jgi:arginine N-succinyltransferase
MPFWAAVGWPLFGLNFPVADKLSATPGNGFIADLAPLDLIYPGLLSDEVKAAIGKPHARPC